MKDNVPTTLSNQPHNPVALVQITGPSKLLPPAAPNSSTLGRVAAGVENNSTRLRAAASRSARASALCRMSACSRSATPASCCRRNFFTITWPVCGMKATLRG